MNEFNSIISSDSEISIVNNQIFYSTLPSDMIKIILLMSGKDEIISMQEMYPELLGFIQVTDLSKINIENYKFIKDGSKLYKLTDTDIKYMGNLTSLNLAGNDKITDHGIKHLVNLTSLNLSYNRRITDHGIEHLINLTTLWLENSSKITYHGLKNMTNLTNLYGSNFRIMTGFKNFHINSTKKVNFCDFHKKIIFHDFP